MKSSERKVELPRFEASDYYEVTQNENVTFTEDEKALHYVTPTFEGGKLIKEYYANKYKANISLISEEKSYNAPYLEKLFQEASSHPAPYREAFLLSFAGGHTTLIIYFKEKNEEGFLLTDSLGIENSEQDFYRPLYDFQKKGVTIYGTADQRQSDMYSCHTDALALGSKAVAIDPKTKNYLYPDLLKNLKENQKQDKYKGITLTTLPTDLLFTVQRPVLLEQKTLQSDKRKKYTKKAAKKLINKPIDYYHYLETKSEKYARLMEIQFYINNMSQLHPMLLTPEIKKDFVKKAKNELRSQESLENRKGLHEFSENFLSETLKQASETEISSPVAKLTSFQEPPSSPRSDKKPHGSTTANLHGLFNKDNVSPSSSPSTPPSLSYWSLFLAIFSINWLATLGFMSLFAVQSQHTHSQAITTNEPRSNRR